MLIIVAFYLVSSISYSQNTHFILKDQKYELTLEGASHLASLPLKCMQTAFPYKTGVVYPDTTLLIKPKDYHPAFYGCFDWHSSVHGHWMLIRLMKLYPNMPEAKEIKLKLSQSLSAENIRTEIKIFQMKENKGFERTYGWAWLLQLQNELLSWDDPFAKQLSENIAPLAQQISSMYLDYLPKMNYPVRAGEHSNLAFGLALAWDYSLVAKDEPLKQSIKSTAVRFYAHDKGCPLDWEPGGSDFLSPCLQEADLMWRILPKGDYQLWIEKFIPSLLSKKYILKPGEVNDRTDGKLVHLDGLNLSRAWCLYGIAKHYPKEKKLLHSIANEHLKAALPNIVSGDYMGEHWLASFAVYALTMQTL